MKAIFFCALLAIGLVANGQDPSAVTQSQTEAVREFPALGQPGSDFNKQFVSRYKALKTSGDATLTHDDWPLVLAKQVATELGIAPAAQATPTAAAEAPKTDNTLNPPNTPGAAKGPAAATKDNPFVNSLGMKFVPVPGSKALFSIWDTRMKDYRAFAEANSGANPRWKKTDFKQTEEEPVASVTWQMAKTFCKWLTQKEQDDKTIGQDWEYRLPTDAEWSTAAGPTKYPYGDHWPPPLAAGNYSPALGEDNFKNTSPVGSFAANKYGLFDMGGNVYQWCEDWYEPKMNDPAVVAKFAVLKQGGGHRTRVIRGGAYYSADEEMIESRARASDRPIDGNGGNGFRCVLAPVGSNPSDESGENH